MPQLQVNNCYFAASSKAYEYHSFTNDTGYSLATLAAGLLFTLSFYVGSAG